ncbi:MAG: hypothetical protein WAO56_10560 [Miniphocaeibacter sp.]|uniref:hypothetical protein n=1 Tax=Miniphocaeibacter sp. TaxID=3100973 RepID=UPI00184C0FE0|nr:hypothetical protein [Gallicola sp.]
MKNIYVVLSLIIFIFLSFYSLYAIANIIKALYRVYIKEYDELERKVVFDSLIITALVIIGVHLIQFILGLTMPYSQFEPIISAGSHSVFLFTNDSIAHIESVFFDFIILSLTYTVMRYKYGLINIKQVLKPMVIICIISTLSSMSLLF